MQILRIKYLIKTAIICFTFIVIGCTLDKENYCEQINLPVEIKADDPGTETIKIDINQDCKNDIVITCSSSHSLGTASSTGESTIGALYEGIKIASVEKMIKSSTTEIIEIFEDSSDSYFEIYDTLIIRKSRTSFATDHDPSDYTFPHFFPNPFDNTEDILTNAIWLNDTLTLMYSYSDLSEPLLESPKKYIVSMSSSKYGTWDFTESKYLGILIESNGNNQYYALKLSVENINKIIVDQIEDLN